MKTGIKELYKRTRSGMALVVVLSFASALLIFCTAYIDQARKKTRFNPMMLTSLQANFLGQGVAQIAALKVKKVPGPIYYAVIASNTSKFTTPYKTYISDSVLNPEFSTPFNARCRTQIYMFPSKMYKQLNFKVAVQVSVSYTYGSETVVDQREIFVVLNGTRRMS
ncbi:MAG: hypothetical protein HQM10_13170 [Candidatus Riflebacteria bacterium]|nr:hypothetical protein [Candidatus Riflebacteria bacterium]